MDMCSNIFCIVLIKIIGKRKMFLLSVMGATICCIGLGLNAWFILPFEASSFDVSTVALTKVNHNYLAMILFLLLAFLVGIGGAIPWMLVSEIFPYRYKFESN